MPNQPSISDLTNQMQQLTQSLQAGGGGKNFRMSEAAHTQYLNTIRDYRDKFELLRNTAAGLTEYGAVGSFYSAVQTKTQLASEITPTAVTSIDQYIEYLDKFENTVNAAFRRMQAEDSGS